MMRHRRGAGREEREVGAPLALELELIGLDAFANLVVADLDRRRPRRRRVLEAGELCVAETLKRGRRGCIMAVTIDDHGAPPPSMDDEARMASSMSPSLSYASASGN